MPAILRLVRACLYVASVSVCFGEWAKTVDCPPGRVYKDLRPNAGREEFCELVLPGHLVVKDGPYRSWFSEGNPGSEGRYQVGREVGAWKECDRFGRCRHTVQEPVFPAEKQRASFKPEVPVSYAQNKYVFDFASCRSTWITQTGNSEAIDLYIHGTSRYRCEIGYVPKSVLDPTHKREYFCRVPFAVGVREFESVDLRSEFPLAHLPQFCRSISPTGEPLIVQKDGETVVTTGDVQRAEIRPSKAGNVFTLELHKYAADLLKQVSSQPGHLITYLCFHLIVGPEIVTDAQGRQRFTYLLSANPAEVMKQRKCALAAFPFESSR